MKTEETDLIRYRDWAPTTLDPKGLSADRYGIKDFYVVPASRNRDSGALEESNFSAALELLGGESDEVQVHRFGHWGPGWFEIILVDPTAADKVAILLSIQDSLADYPVLDDNDLSEREWKAASDYWACMDMRERVRMLTQNGDSIFAARCESFSDLSDRAESTYQRVYDSARE